jgi:tetratricopeptide (TPR) repeat protein
MSGIWSAKALVAISVCAITGVGLAVGWSSFVNHGPKPSPFADKVWSARYWNELSSGRYDGLLAVLDKAEKSFPDNPELLQQKCTTLILSSRPKEALALVPRVLHSGSTANNHLIVAFTYYANRMYANAVEESTKALQQDEKSWRALGVRAMARYRLNQHAQALADADAGLRLAKEHNAGPVDIAQFYSAKALAFRGLQRFQLAIDTCAAGMELDPRGSGGEMQSVLESMYRLSGDHTKADDFATQSKIFGWTEADRMQPFAYALAPNKDQQKFPMRIDTEHLIFFADNTDDQVIRLAINGEILIKMYDQYFVPLTANYPFNVYTFQYADGMSRFLKEAKGISQSGVLGLTSRDQRFIATGDYFGSGTLAHELMHKVLDDRYTSIPDQWAVEGIPELMEKFYGYRYDDKCVIYWGQQNALLCVRRIRGMFAN